MQTPAYGLGSLHKKSWRSIAALFFLVAWSLACLSYCTQAIAEAYGYHPAFGTPVRGSWYWPWACVVWLRAMPDLRTGAEDIISNTIMIFSAPFGVYVFFTLVFGRKVNAKDDVHGTARWANKEDIEKTELLSGEGVYVGGWKDKGFLGFKYLRYLRDNSPSHVLAFAPTRSGKGIGLVLPTLLSWLYSSITLDIKGENYALTAGYRQKVLKHRVFRFEPTDTTGTSARFNPLSEVRLDTLNAIADVQNICAMIMDPDGKGLNNYFEKAGDGFLVGALLHTLVIKRAEGKIATMADVVECVADERFEDIYEFLRSVLDTQHRDLLQEAGIDKAVAEHIHKAVHSAIAECNAKADRELSGVVSSAMTNLRLYRDPIVAANTSTSDFTIHDLMNADDPVDLYLVVRPSDIDRLRPLMRLFLNIALRRLTESMQFAEGRSVSAHKHKLLLMMDEFTALGRLEIFQRALAFMGGYGIKAYLIVQDLTQLHEAYSKNESITSNCHTRIAFAPNNIDTANLLSAMTGKATVLSKKTSLSGRRSSHLGNATVSVSEISRPLLTAEECMRLPGPEKDSKGNIKKPGEMLIFSAGSPPVRGTQILYFKDPVFSARAKIPAPGQEPKSSKMDVGALFKTRNKAA